MATPLRQLRGTPQVVDAGAHKGSELLHPESLNVHDGQPESWSFAENTFLLTLLVGDLQRGYEWVEIAYHR